VAQCKYTLILKGMEVMPLYKKTFQTTLVCYAENAKDADDVFVQKLRKIDFGFNSTSPSVLIEHENEIPEGWLMAFPLFGKGKYNADTESTKCKFLVKR